MQLKRFATILLLLLAPTLLVACGSNSSAKASAFSGSSASAPTNFSAAGSSVSTGAAPFLPARNLFFPEDRSFGMIHLVRWDPPAIAHWMLWTKNARGEVSVPQGLDVILTVSPFVEDFSVLRKLSPLDVQHLILSDTAMNDDALDSIFGFSSLEFLDLSGTAITDASLDRIASMTTLKMLYVSNTGVSPRGLRDIHRALPNCLILPPAPTPTPRPRKGPIG